MRANSATLCGVLLTHDDIIQAIAAFDREWPSTASYDDWLVKGTYKYALRYHDKVYPPKRILSLASGVRVRRFNGGSQSNHLLVTLGFDVAEKP
jgi:hypothetical protein